MFEIENKEFCLSDVKSRMASGELVFEETKENEFIYSLIGKIFNDFLRKFVNNLPHIDNGLFETL